MFLGVADSGKTRLLLEALVDPKKGWGAWVTWAIMLLILLPEIRDVILGKFECAIAGGGGGVRGRRDRCCSVRRRVIGADSAGSSGSGSGSAAAVAARMGTPTPRLGALVPSVRRLNESTEVP